MPTLLCCYAHPDDESFLVAGTACLCRQRGIRTVLMTATLGQAGRCGTPPFCTRQELPRVREHELRCACRLLGIDQIDLLGFEDGKLAQAPIEQVRPRMVGLIRGCRPEVVATFDPQGLNLHPDHIAVSRFAADAVAAAADPRFFPELGPEHRVQRLLWTPPVAVWDLEARGPWEKYAGVDFQVDIRSFWAIKKQALECHRTQSHSIRRYFLERPDLPEVLSVEAFRQAWGPSLPRRPCPDLFDGLLME